MKMRVIRYLVVSIFLVALMPWQAYAWTGESSWTSMTRGGITTIANEMIDSTWSPANNINNFGYGSTWHQFYSSTTYTGEAYSQNNPQEDWDEFEAAVNATAGGNTYYGNDCSGFVSMCWQLLSRYTTTTFSQNLNGTYFYALGAAGSAASVNLLQGDALNDPGNHIVLFNAYQTGGIQTMEQTPWNAVRMTRTYTWLNGYRPMRRNSLQGGFQVGNVVETTSNLNVRSCAGTSCSVLATQPSGSVGTIVGAAQDADDYRWWQVQFSSQLTGWCVEGYLKTSSGRPDMSISSSGITFNPPPPVAPGTQVTITANILNIGEIDGTCDVTFEYYDISSSTYVTIGTQTGISVSAASSQNVSTSWDTSGLNTGSMTVFVKISNTIPQDSNALNNSAYTDFALPIELMGVSTRRVGDTKVLITWQTASETQNREWHILRRNTHESSQWSIVNHDPIPGAGTAPFGKKYQYVDRTVLPNALYEYKLEWVSSDGQSESSDAILLDETVGGFMAPSKEKVMIRHTMDRSKIVYDVFGIESLSRGKSADYLIIAPSILKNAAIALAQYRNDNGHKSEIITAEDIYAAFPSDMPRERAIRAFLIHAYHHWPEPKLRYVLLIGDAILFSDGTQISSEVLLPTFAIDVESVGLIPTDHPYACVNGSDAIPELSIGRLPVRSSEELTHVMNKIIQYEASASSKTVIFANGDYVMPGDEYSEIMSETIIQDFCKDLYNVERIYTTPVSDELSPYVGGPQQLMDLLDQGSSWCEYRGHGSGSDWAGLLNTEDALNLSTNAPLPIVMSTSCYTASFADANDRLSMAEALVKNPQGGSVAYIGNTGHGMVFSGYFFSKLVWDQINDHKKILGDILTDAKVQLVVDGGGEGFLHSINLLGDPATIVKLTD